ncbi:MAG: hypothetical protein EXR72_06290 [Myxococcales bacterium]|nr:hypothetical protein [Myxococcales bacterium]
MPGRRRRADRPIEEALSALDQTLSTADVPWMIIGGIAIIARGVRRLTTDIDALVRGDAITIEALLRAFARQKIVPRLPGAAAFARENLVLLLRHAPTGVDLDVSLGWSEFEHEAIAARSPVAYGRVTAPMASPDDLVVFKAVAARPRDLVDAEALLVLHPAIDIARVRRRLAQLAELADAPELLAGLDGVLARAKLHTSKAIRKPRPRR